MLAITIIEIGVQGMRLIRPFLRVENCWKVIWSYRLRLFDRDIQYFGFPL